MRTDQDLERAVRLWVAEGSDRLPDRELDTALDRIAITKQRHARWLARRINLMNGNALKLGLAAVAIIAVALLGVRFLPSMVGSPPDPTPIPTPTAVTLASGSFTAPLGEFGEAFDIHAIRTGDDVSGTMEISNPAGGEGAYSIAVECARTTDEGFVVIGGEVTESTYEEFVAEGAYVVLAFAPGTPVRMLWAVDVIATDDPPAPAESCSAYLESWLGDPGFVEAVNVHGNPITGELELNP
ncbi:MAG TPA: hypothetical protein VI277_06015 [Candidatus Limnocylindria bacterium]